jgi:hypothetical protein
VTEANLPSQEENKNRKIPRFFNSGLTKKTAINQLDLKSPAFMPSENKEQTNSKSQLTRANADQISGMV